MPVMIIGEESKSEMSYRKLYRPKTSVQIDSRGGCQILTVAEIFVCEESSFSVTVERERPEDSLI
jgi:hypothetical protein